MTGPKQNAATFSNVADGLGGWAPRLAQEFRLRALEDALGRRPVESDAIAIEVERAVLLGALDRRAEAQQAFIDILRRAPQNFSALNEFGTLLTAIGAVDAACRVYAEAILHHPENPMGRVNLANLLLRANRHAEARDHYEAVLQIHPDHAEAHQGLGAVLSDLGDRTAARITSRRDFAITPFRPCHIAGPSRRSPCCNWCPPAAAISRLRSCWTIRTFLTSVIVADYLDPSMALPPHQLIFNAIGDADLCEPALEAAARLIARTTAPVINDPCAVMKTGRIDNARRLGDAPGVITPRTVAMARDLLYRPRWHGCGRGPRFHISVAAALARLSHRA